MVYSLGLRWTVCRLTMLDSRLHLHITPFLQKSNDSLFLCIFFFQQNIWCSFSSQVSWLWFGCHSFVRVTSMSVAPSCLPPPTPVLLNELFGSLALARSGASSSTLYWPPHNSHRVISACLGSHQLDWTLPGPLSGRTKSLSRFWFSFRWILSLLSLTDVPFWRILRLSYGTNWIITV